MSTQASETTVLSNVGLIAGCWLLAIWVRLSYLPYAQVTSDTLSPFVAGIRWWNTGFFQPANPESDQWLWILSLPLVGLANSLSQLFWWKCVATTVVVPISMSLIMVTVEKHARFWAVVMAVILTLDMGLVDTMLSSFRGYWAPECMALVCVGLVYWEKGCTWGAHLATVATVVAMGQHPLVLGCTPALMWLWWSMWRREASWWWAVLLAVVCVIPRGFWIWELMQCDAGGFACLTDIAVSSSEDTTFWSMISAVLVDRLWVEMGFASVLMLWGWQQSSTSILRQWTILSALGIAVLGLSIDTLRPYHFRVLIIPTFMVAIQGLSQLDWKGLSAGVLWCACVLFFRIEPVAWFSVSEHADAVAAHLCDETGPIWLEGYGADLQVSPQSVGVSMMLQGCAVELASSPTEDIWLLENRSAQSNLSELPAWHNDVVQLQRVSKTKWRWMSTEQQWSGHDVAILFWDPSLIQLD